MKHDQPKRFIALTALAVFAFAALGVSFMGGENYDLSWHTIDAGGGTSTGATFALSGTTGQHDAGGPMTGGTFSLTGGFWAGAGGPQSEIATLTDLTVIEGVHNSGGLPELIASDDQYYFTEHHVTGEAAEAHRLQYILGAETTRTAGNDFTITFEGRTADPVTTVTLFLMDWDAGLEQVGQFGQGLTDTTSEVNVSNANQYIRASDGRIEMLIKKHIVLPSALGGTPSWDDQIEISVR